MTSEPIRTASAAGADESGESRDPLTAAEAAQLLRVGKYSALELCRSGELRAYKPGKSWLIYREDVDAYIKAHSNQPADQAQESA